MEKEEKYTHIGDVKLPKYLNKSVRPTRLRKITKWVSEFGEIYPVDENGLYPNEYQEHMEGGVGSPSVLLKDTIRKIHPEEYRQPYLDKVRLANEAIDHAKAALEQAYENLEAAEIELEKYDRVQIKKAMRG